MACHNIYMKNEEEFFKRMKERDSDIIIKMVKCVISAFKRKRPSINIFDISFKDTSSMTFAMQKQEYKKFLENCLNDLIQVEEYEMCAEIKKIITTNTRQRRKKAETQE